MHNWLEDQVAARVHPFWYIWYMRLGWIHTFNRVIRDLLLILTVIICSRRSYGYHLVLSLRRLKAFCNSLWNIPSLPLIVCQVAWMYEDVLSLSQLFVFRSTIFKDLEWWTSLWLLSLSRNLMLLSAYGLKTVHKVQETPLSCIILWRLLYPLDISQFLVDSIDLALSPTWLLNNKSWPTYLIILILLLI